MGGAWRKQYDKNRREKYRKLVLEHYGNKCACCGENEPLFLTIDHVNEDGASHRRSISTGKGTGTHLRMWLVKNNFPPGFQILCWNCNCGKHYNNGICPHTKERTLD